MEGQGGGEAQGVADPQKEALGREGEWVVGFWTYAVSINYT
jgi:hypothetical protein